MHPNIHSGTIYKSQDMDATQVSINRRMGKEYVICMCNGIFSSVQLSCSVVSDSLWPQELQHTRPPCPSPTPGVHPDSHPSSQWYHPAMSSSVIPFSSCPQSLLASESFPMSQLFAWGGQSTDSVIKKNELQKNICSHTCGPRKYILSEVSQKKNITWYH